MAGKHKADSRTGRWLVWSVAMGLVLIAVGALTLIAPIFQLSYNPTGSGGLAAAAETPAPTPSDRPASPEWGEEVPAPDLQYAPGTESGPDSGLSAGGPAAEDNPESLTSHSTRPTIGAAL